MDQENKIIILYNECIEELKNIGIDMLNKEIGKINITISKRNNKRYGCCKQGLPDTKTQYYEIIRRKKHLKYTKYEKHTIEISKWVMELDNNIIKNTIIHELIHCIPYCNNHGEMFKKYAIYINSKLGYNISRVGNKEEDYKQSKKEYNEREIFNYKIICEQCNQTFYRKRLQKNYLSKYRCGKCGGKLKFFKLGGKNEKSKIK